MTELNRSFTEAGFRLDSIVDNLYAQYRSFGEILYAEQNRKLVLGNRIYTPENSLTPEFIEARAATNDIAVISFGRLSGEGNDRRPWISTSRTTNAPCSSVSARSFMQRVERSS